MHLAREKSRAGRTGLWIFAAAALLAIMPVFVGAETKNFYFPEVRIDINIERDGSFIVDEFRTYDFEGSFTWGTLWIPLSVNRQGYRYDVSVEDLRIFDEKGEPLRTETSSAGRTFQAKWYYQARNEKRTFHIHYHVRNGIISYPDVSELYWQAIGEDETKPTKEVTITITLPEPVASKDDLLVYGHGPLSGWAEIVDAQTARFTATDLRAHQFLEIRMVWPAGMVAGVPSTRSDRDSIRKEEARFVQETIEKAKQTQARKEQQNKILVTAAGIWAVWLILGSLLWFFFYVRFWKKVGKDYHFNDIPEYYRELPSTLQPALVEVLLKEGGSITPRSFTATLFDLARRGYLELDDRPVEKRGLFGTKEDFETTVILKKDYAADRQLLPYEIDVLKLLFEDVVHQGSRVGANFKLEELKAFLKKKPQTFQTWYRQWAKSIRQESKKLVFIEPQSLKMRNIFVAVTIPVAILTLNPILGILGAVFIPRIKRREKNWAREYELWKSLDHFLDDFSDFKEVPPEAYKLWEHYLVFAIVFGNAKKIIKMLPLILQDKRAVAPIWYYGFAQSGFASSGRIAGMIRSIETMSTSIQQASMAAAHYSSGGGGGFSGGGGGGGGGGGHGAG
jgi:uncharacterized membrane protein